MNNKKTNKHIALGLGALLAVSAVMGCGGKNSGGSGENSFTYWAPLDSKISTISPTWGDTPLYKKLQEVTGINVNFIHPPTGNNVENFNILMASSDLPDVIQFNWTNYAGGPGKAISDGVIEDLYEYKDKIPNLMKYLNANHDIKKIVETGDGQLFSFPFVRGDESLVVSLGLAVRGDWLKELGLEAPETMDEWENMLRQFKTKKGADAALYFSLSSLKYGLFTGAYNCCYDYYVNDGKVTYGMLEPGFKECLARLNKWYKEGLIDQSFSVTDQATLDSYVLNGKTGALALSLGGGIGKYLSTALSEEFDLAGTKSPVLNKGTYPEFGFYQSQVPPTMNGTFTVLTKDSKNKDAAMKFLDFGYSDEGHMIYNFGIEGESYNMIDDYPTYTDLITKNPDGYPMNVMLAQYTGAVEAGPFIQDKRYMEQYAAKPQQREAWDLWTESNMKKHLLPNLYIGESEQAESAQIDNDIKTYADEMVTKMIIGTESIDNYDNVVEELKRRGIERAIEIRQSAYDEYLKK